MTDRAVTGVGVGGQEQVTFFDGAVVGLFKAVDKATELADHHLAFQIGDHREHIVLLTNPRRHRRPKHDRIHLVAGVHHRVFDDVEGDWVDILTLEFLGVGFNDCCRHCYLPSLKLTVLSECCRICRHCRYARTG